MDINALKTTRIVGGFRDESITVITLTGGAAAYCIYKGVEQAAKKIDEKTSNKSVTLIRGLAPFLYTSNDNSVRRILERSIGDVRLY